jgi:hypothetical protein
MNICKLLLSIVLISSSSLFADGITISQSVDKTETAFEDSIIFEIGLTWEGNPMAYRFPKPLSPYFEKFKVRGFSSSINSFLNDGVEYTKKTYKFTLKPNLSGQANITPVAVSYISMPDSIEGELLSESFYITIANPIPKEVTEELPYYWYMLTILVIIGLGVAYFYFKFYGKVEDKATNKSSEQSIILEIDKLHKEAGSNIKIFQTGFYRLMVGYLSKSYGIEIQALKSDELLEKLNNADITKAQAVKMHKWLTQAEKDKYSPISSQPGEVVRLVTEIKQFFENNITEK